MSVLNFSKQLCVAALIVALALPVTALAQPSPAPNPSNEQDFLFIEMLLSMSGAVIGSAAGVFGWTQWLEFTSSCGNLTPDEASVCRDVQTFQALCVGDAIGIPLGATASFFLSELLFEVRGSILGALMGSMIGELLGRPECSLIQSLQSIGLDLNLNATANSDISVLINPFVLAAVGATIGYNFELLFGLSGAPGASFSVPVFQINF